LKRELLLNNITAFKKDFEYNRKRLLRGMRVLEKCVTADSMLVAKTEMHRFENAVLPAEELNSHRRKANGNHSVLLN
jgi:hypothetical protein